MGMAASQARFLTLTARKSNTEYQGQQVNQQRTALSNESANIYNKLANMDVPTAPSKTSFNKNIYTLKDANGEKYSIMNIAQTDKDDSSKVKVQVKYNDLANFAKSYNLGAVSNYNEAEGKLSVMGTNSLINYQVSDCANENVPEEIRTKLGIEEGSRNDFVFIQRLNDDEVSEKGFYVLKSDLNSNNSETIQYHTIETTSTPVTKEVDAVLTQNSAGRYDSISFTGNHTLPFNEATSLSYEYGTDEEEYERAFADYEFKKAQYDKEVDVLNAKTEVIQNQDKRLELKLKQLDTERQALNTEMEAVKGYLKKNVEGTFNTFG